MDGQFGLGTGNTVLAYEPAIFRPPAYPYFMSSVYHLFGRAEDMREHKTWHKNWDKVRIVQAALDAAVCILVFAIVRILSPTSTVPAYLSAALYSVSSYNIYYTRALLSESLATFLFTCALLSVVLALWTQKKRLWLLSGIGFGLVALATPQLVLFPIGLSGLRVAQEPGRPVARVTSGRLVDRRNGHRHRPLDRAELPRPLGSRS